LGFALQLIRSVYKQQFCNCELETTILLTDDGCENKPIAKALQLDADISITHLIAQKDIVFSNSMIEYLNKTIKYRYLYQQQIVDCAQLQSVLDFAVTDYNNRPANNLHGLTPIEALAGSCLNISFRKEKIKVAANQRIAINLADGCCYISK
jgi:putative transposase